MATSKSIPPRTMKPQPSAPPVAHGNSNMQVQHAVGHESANDDQGKIDRHWNLLSEEIREFLLEITNARDLSLCKLVVFWLSPKRLLGTLAGHSAGVSLYLAYLLLSQGKIDLAKTLLLNGAFLQHCCNVPPEEVMTLDGAKELDIEVIKVKMPLYYSGVLASADKVSMKKYLDAYSLPTDQRRQPIRLHGSNKQISGHFAHIIVPSISKITEWTRLSSSDQRRKEGDAANNDAKVSSIEIIFRDSDNNHQEVKMAIGLSTPLKTLFNNYSEEQGESLRSLRFSFKCKTLFLSSAGHLTPEEFGMKNLDLIYVSAFVESPSRNKENEPKDIPSHKSLLRRKKKSSGAKANTRKRRSSPRAVAVEDYTEFMVRHSLALTKLFDEVDAKFKEIRQELNTLNIEHTQPKANSRHKKSAVTPDQPINHPPMYEIGGKAGKTSFAVLVGGSHNVYKTSKPSARRNRALSAPHPIVLDLHGLTKDQALAKLDDCLPEWTDIAMQGCHPFVQQVVIVCGGGNQILSESVEHWIRHNDGVSNAPKNMFVR